MIRFNISKYKEAICLHLQKIEFNNKKWCENCGSLIPKNGLVFKSISQNFNSLFDPLQLYHKLNEQRFEDFQIDESSIYYQKREQMIDWIFNLAWKLQLSKKTTHLAVYFLDYFNNKCQSTFSQYELISASCLLLACKLFFYNLLYKEIAKAVELDKNIPFISKLLKQVQSFISKIELKKCENFICEIFQWKFQKSTFYEMVEHILSFGILTSSDSYQSQTLETIFTNGDQGYKTIQNLVSKVENDSLKLCKLFLKDPKSITWKIKNSSSAIIAFSRKVNNLLPIWQLFNNYQYFVLRNYQMEQITSLQFEEIEQNFEYLYQNYKDFFLTIEYQTIDQDFSSPLKQIENFDNSHYNLKVNSYNFHKFKASSSKYNQKQFQNEKYQYQTYLNENQKTLQNAHSSYLSSMRENINNYSSIMVKKQTYEVKDQVFQRQNYNFENNYMRRQKTISGIKNIQVNRRFGSRNLNYQSSNYSVLY